MCVLITVDLYSIWHLFFIFENYSDTLVYVNEWSLQQVNNYQTIQDEKQEIEILPKLV